MGLIQPLQFGASQADWDSWMMALTSWASNLDDNSAGLPITKQGIDNLMQMSGSTSNAFLMYFVSSLPPSPSFPTQVVYNGQDGRIYAWSAAKSAWVPTGATAFDQLTGFLQAGQLLIGNQINICTNGCFTYDTVGQTPSGWSTNSSVSNAPVTVTAGSNSPAGCPTDNCIYVQGRDTYFTAGNGFDVKPGENYYLESYMASDGTTPGIQVGLYFPAVGANGPAWVGAFIVPGGLSGWTNARGVVSVPSWANRAQVWIQVNSNSATPSSYGNNWFTGVECVKSPSLLQSYAPFGSTALSTGGGTIFTGNFTTGYASIIFCGLDCINASTGGINLSVQLSIDGSLVDSVAPNFASTSGVAVPASLLGITTTPGAHTFTITASSGNGAWTQSIQARNISVLNLLK